MGTLHKKRLTRLFLLLIAGCTGDIGGLASSPSGAGDRSEEGSLGADGVTGSPGLDGSGRNADVPGGSNLPGGAAASAVAPLRCETKAVGPSPLRRITHAEYDNSVAALLGDSTHPARAFAADTQVGLFDNTAEVQTVPTLLADQYLQTAVTLAEGVKDLKALYGCDPAVSSTASSCVRGFVQRFGRRAYRRPLTSAEITDLLAVYSETSAASDGVSGARAVIAAILVSPNFLFRPEFGAGSSALPKAKQASAFELAGRLASLLWASVPDDTLLDAAQSGKLETREQVAVQARRMLADPRARPAVGAFYQQWFGLSLLESASKDAALFPQFNDSLRDAMAEETRRFIAHVLWESDAKLSTLLTAPYSFVNASLAKLYGVKAPSDATSFVRSELDPQQRSGVLTHASLMSTFASPSGSSPIKRGKWLRVRMLCQDLPEPPANIPPPPAPAAGVSTRERFAMHTNSPACSGCHKLIDGLGFGLEHYDGIGAYRTVDQGVPVDASGEIKSTDDINGAYEGAPELGARLARSQQVRDCAPTQWFRYAVGRHERDDDTCSIVSLRTAFAASGGDLRELMVALTQTDAFYHYRQPE